ncbi:fatty acid synthase-like [Periplaneta americana]|uniref:fatty acid synthase-like n=1 Tax=Periplaneta americana TaxID=6978 RepID=UPI0037E77840
MKLENETYTITKEAVMNGHDYNQFHGYWDPHDPIVISGMAGRFPECDNVEEFMDNLYAGVEFAKVTDRRWPNGFCNLPDIGTLKDISHFDAAYFGIPPKHVQVMDPQLRIALELTYEALIDAGRNPADVRGSNTGVYYAVSASDADIYWGTTEERANGIGMLGSSRTMFANRIAFQFDFTGPSFSVDSGCATSLVALNQAVIDMRIGRVDAAIVCSTNLMLNPFYTQHLFKLGVLSPHSVSNVFDASASGYVRSEAAVVLYLQKKSQTKRVYAELLHVRTNTDGFKTAGITCPSGERQKENNSALYKEAGVDPSSVGYIEAHGTGTQVGDREELNGIAELFCKHRQSAFPIGSLKSSVGHTEAAAGLCSMVKVIFAMHTGLIPPNINFKEPNTAVPSLLDGRLQVVTRTQVLPNDLVGINAFGFGGTNGHVLLRKYKKEKATVTKDDLPRLVGVSGRTELAVTHFLDKIESLPRDDNFVGLLHDIHQNSIHRHGYRGYTILNAKSPAREVVEMVEEKRPLWFICTGWGAQWLGVLKDLMKFEVFENRIRLCSMVLESEGINIYDIIKKGCDEIPDDIVVIFTIIGATQLALVDLLRSLGIEPDALVGISTGELTCAYADGAVTAEQVMKIAYHTGRWTRESNLPAAAMAVVGGLTIEQVKMLCPPEIVVAVHNDAKTCTIVGPEQQVPNFVNSLVSRGISAKMIKSSGGIAFHSPHIAEEANVLAKKIRNIIPDSKKARKHWISSSLPTRNGDLPLVKNFAADYFMNIVTNTVLTKEALQHIPDNAIVVEISPHCALQSALQKVLPATTVKIALASRNEANQVEYLLAGLGKMYNAGVQMNLAKLYSKIQYPVPSGTHMIGSLVRWDHSVEWTVPKLGFKKRKDGSRPKKCSFAVDVTTEKDKYLKGHIVNHQHVFPQAGYLVLAWKAFAEIREEWFENLSVKMENVEFYDHTLFPDSGVLTFIVKFSSNTGDSSSFEMYESNRLLASGFISKQSESEDESFHLPESTHEPNLLPLNTDDIYTEFRMRGFQYTGQFQSLMESDNRGTHGKVTWQKNWITFLDSVFQFTQLGINTRDFCLPKGLQKLKINTKIHDQELSTLLRNEGVSIKKNQTTGLVSSGGIKLQGLEFNLEKVDTAQKDPQLEKVVFVPYISTEMSLLGDTTEISRVNALSVMVQIVHENLPQIPIKNIVELTDKSREYSLLAPELVPLLMREPMLNANVTVVTDDPQALQQSASLESLGIKVEDVNSSTLRDMECHLLLGSSSEFLPQAVNHLKSGSFLLLERNVFNEETQMSHFSLVAKQCTGSSAFLLLRKDQRNSNSIVIKVTSQNFNWVKKLQTAINNNKYSDSKIILVAEDDNQCGLLGLTTCLMRETISNHISCVFIQDPKAPLFSLQEPMYASQIDKQLRTNVYRNGTWGSMRHIELHLQNGANDLVEFAQMEVLNTGDLSSISWVESPLKFYKTEDCKELCNVHYASVDLTDVLLIKGDVRLDTQQNLLPGKEFSGYNSSGQRVMGFVPFGALATHVSVLSDFLWKVPDHLSLEQAATIPSAYITSFYALLIRDHIRSGEWVLIHSEGSAIGQAAIAVCKHMGCHVIVTVCNEEEHDRLKLLFQHLSESRVVHISAAEEQVLTLTGGRGVDVVFNTLPSSDQDQVLFRCLAHGGRFLDVALSDVPLSKKLGVSTLKNKSYHSIQVDNLFNSQNQDRHEVTRLMKTALESGIVTPLPAKVYPENNVKEAFRFVSSSRHAGKVLVKIQTEGPDKLMSPEVKLVSAISKFIVNPEKVYVIAGGLGNVGMEVAQWLVQRGVRKLLLTSRRAVTVGYKSMLIRRWRDSGVSVVTSTQDITTEEGANKLLQEANKLGSVEGILVLTMVLRDALFHNQTEENFKEVCKAKVDVTRSLDVASQRLCPDLRHFVVFSSMTCGRGNSGQTPYGMANSVMERMCEARRAAGLPATAIQWGPIADVGVIFNTIGNESELMGAVPQHIRSVLTSLEKILRHPHAVMASHVIPDKEVKSSSGVGTEDFMSTVANVLGIDNISSVYSPAGTDDFGIDSITSTELMNTFENQYNMKLSPQEIFDLMASTMKEQSV